MVLNKDIASRVAQMLLQVKAIKLQPQDPFTWASGWKSPIYCDNRISLSNPEVRSYIKQQLADTIKAQFPDVTVISGVATAGIAQGALVADILELPYAYVRPEPKKHGLGNQIEGRIEPTDKVVLIEDLISTGGSAIKAAEAVAKTGAEVLGIMAIFDYGFENAVQNMANAGIKYFTLSNYEHLLPEAVVQGTVQQDQLEILKAWRQAPAEWSVTA